MDESPVQSGSHATLIRLPDDVYQWLRREKFDTGQSFATITARALTEYRNRREQGRDGK